MNDLREKIMKQLDRLLDFERGDASVPVFGTMHYYEIVDNLEALVVGYSVDVTSDTLSDIAAVDENSENNDSQDDEAKPKTTSFDFSSEKEKFIAP